MRQFLLKPSWIVLTVLVSRGRSPWCGPASGSCGGSTSVAAATRWSADVPPPRSARARCSAPTTRSTRPGPPAEWRSVEASGTYDTGAEVLIRNRSFDGAPGYHVVTPLVIADGTALLVNRGWIPLSPEGGSGPRRARAATAR